MSVKATEAVLSTYFPSRSTSTMASLLREYKDYRGNRAFKAFEDLRSLSDAPEESEVTFKRPVISTDGPVTTVSDEANWKFPGMRRWNATHPAYVDE